MLHTVTRRDFLATSAAAASALTLSQFPAARAADDASYYGGWPVGIQSYTLRNFKLDEALRHVKGLGLKHIEFYSAHMATNSNADQIAEMKKKLADAGVVRISAHGVNGFSKDHAANRKLFEFAKAAGIKNITADPSPDSFESLDKLCEEFDIRIAIHNHGPGHRYDKLTDLAKAVKDHHKSIGVCVDTGHVLRSNEDPVAWVRELGPRVFGLHLKDVAEKTAKTHDVVIGSKFLDLVSLFKAMKEVKFPADGSISLEYESNPQNPIDDVKQCLAAASAAIEKAKG